MQQVNSSTAYLTWCLCLFGICGGQRFYTGNIGLGLVYLFTFGLFGVGQVIDLVLIPGMVEKRNFYLQGKVVAGSNHLVTLNIGEIPQPKGLGEFNGKTFDKSPMQKLLKAAKEQGGQLSMAQAAMSTELEAEDIKKLLQEAQRVGYAQIGNDPTTGAIRYFFDI